MLRQLDWLPWSALVSVSWYFLVNKPRHNIEQNFHSLARINKTAIRLPSENKSDCYSGNYSYACHDHTGLKLCLSGCYTLTQVEHPNKIKDVFVIRPNAVLMKHENQSTFVKDQVFFWCLVIDGRAIQISWYCPDFCSFCEIPHWTD